MGDAQQDKNNAMAMTATQRDALLAPMEQHAGGHPLIAHMMETLKNIATIQPEERKRPAAR